MSLKQRIGVFLALIILFAVPGLQAIAASAQETDVLSLLEERQRAILRRDIGAPVIGGHGGDMRHRALRHRLRHMRTHQAGKAQIVALDKSFIERNISPGGVADLLAATYFLYIIENNNKIC